MSTAIEFNHVGKQYRLGTVGTGTLSHDLNRWWQTSILGKEDPYLKIGDVNDRSTAATSDYVWALRDIDFKVEQGDVVGIIGKNGAGKSTLLKLLSRVTGPTVGTINAKGRIASLLEVGTGFHGEMTGRENIFMNGSIMGMTKQEINAKLDEIVAFSGCEKYIDTPVKRYSSGMTVRLGFAVAAFLEPEILVVDEVLAVGDAEFQKKAIGKMKDVSREKGRTVLFVSHNMTAVRNLCNNGVWLENGMIKELGGVESIVANYLRESQQYKRNVNTFLKDTCEHKSSGEGVSVQDFRLLNDIPKTGDDLIFEVDILNENNTSKAVEVAINFADADERQFLEFNTKDYGKNVELHPGHNKIRIKKPNFPLLEGDYVMNLWVGSNDNIVDWYLRCFVLHVESGLIDGVVPRYRGCPIFLPCEWSFE